MRREEKKKTTALKSCQTSKLKYVKMNHFHDRHEINKKKHNNKNELHRGSFGRELIYEYICFSIFLNYFLLLLLVFNIRIIIYACVYLYMYTVSVNIEYINILFHHFFSLS